MPDRTQPQPAQPTPGNLYVAAARAYHFTHCTRCREINAASEATATENAESIARRDRRTLGLRRTTAVTA
ncbi:hypothetical protein [Streptomyces rubradiris]|uniref:Uncharacterized protein n=1 Tax=Streptomyces rubradiris TaxID=285531 RepID=A0ABQ3R3G7_STRRR|nr:hypothetical protein [Streptomyces rubradiris]GHH30132.1 hypothetical protein GCM10018792_76200 [Streptomyces rubradiris]GHI50401.1 hypothetical protein Srubr_02470 [Streptomyces rubradiris]